MSATEEREIEIVAGTIGGITQKKADTWTVAVTPEGSQYAKNLWTKDVELVEALQTKIGQAGSFVCEASYWEREGKQIRSLWVQSSGPDGEAVSNVDLNPPRSVATPAAAPIAGASKDRLIVRQAVIKAACDLYSGSEVTPEDVMDAAAKFERWVTLGILDPIPFD